MNQIAEIDKYPHMISVRVRNFEVDSQGIVHNAVYLNYCEIGRVEYVRTLGIQLLPTGIFDNQFKINVKRNEINYESPAYLDDLLNVHTRISYIKNSSFCFDHIIMRPSDRTLIITQKSVQVNLNLKTGRPERLPDDIRKIIMNFDKSCYEI
ncbi:MAG: acyl-CoA thioesterase [Ignavibacteria bacterium]|nr:acyl-CoA thioesterase [Ignavibacteria bacterium]